jgi:hypothetical protein
MAPVDVVVEDELDFGPGYLLEPIAAAWRRSGRDVALRRIGEPRQGVIGLFHINRTVLPAAAAAAADGYAATFNGDMRDQSKRAVSGALLRRDDPYDGPVIVKTDANAGGGPDSRKRKRYGGWTLAGRLATSLRRSLPWRLSRVLPHGRYPILASLAEVPDWVWKREELVVEKFTPERSEFGYVTRNWLFLGSAERSIVCHGTGPIVKRDNTIRVDLTDEVPAELRAARERLRCDYGKIDWLMTGEGPVILDVNATPTFSAMSERMKGIVADLSAGLGNS